MADRDTVTQLGRLLGAAARGHHEAHGADPAPNWADWYASWLEGKLESFVGFDPTVGQITAWLQEADTRYRSEQPDIKWPYFYAELILDSLAPTAR
ncbi:MAG TPA: hypothetical protein VFV13_14310 [Acidimicrobiia bacterium]|nr:hypothetical protein [Acidimicrobiia bacterium]